MAGIRKKLKAIKNRLRRMVSKTPKRKFYYGWRKRSHGFTRGSTGCSMPQRIKRSTKLLWTRRDCKWSWWM